MLILESEAELAALHSGKVKESLHLEYKSSDAINKSDNKTKIEMARDVSAFANSDGGQIVYGMTEQDNEPAGLDGGLDPIAYPEIWFEQVLQQQVTPKLEGLRCKHVPLSNGRVAVVLSVPRTQGDPHQVSDNKYYRRHSFNRLPMEHYEIRDAFNRQSAPALFMEADIREQHKQLTFLNTGSKSGPVTLELCIGNRSNTPSMYTVLHLYIDKRLEVASPGAFVFHSHAEKFKIYTRKLSIPDNFPVFKEQLVSLNEKSFNLEFPFMPQGVSRYYHLEAHIFCPGFAGQQRWRLRELNHALSMEMQ